MITPLEYITGELLREWLEDFEKNNKEYGNMHTELGVGAQYVDMHRKMGKLRLALWDRADISNWRENPREIVMDLIGHCFLMLERMDADNLYPKRKRGREPEEPATFSGFQPPARHDAAATALIPRVPAGDDRFA